MTTRHRAALGNAVVLCLALIALAAGWVGSTGATGVPSTVAPPSVGALAVPQPPPVGLGASAAGPARLGVPVRTAGVPAGTYQLVGTLRGQGYQRLLVNGQEVAAGFSSLGAASTLTAVAWIAGPSVPLAAAAGPGGTAELTAVTLRAVPPTYTVAGASMLDPHGRPVVLHGVNKPGLEQRPAPLYDNPFDAAQMASWGATSVRLAVSQAYLTPSGCGYSPGYAGLIDSEVANLTARGLYVILDLHSAGVAECTAGSPGPVNGYAAPDQRAPAFWRTLAARYTGNPLVGFGLFNEPFHVTPAMWRDGGQVDGFAGVGEQALYDAVRSTGARNLVFVSGGGFSSDLRVATAAPLSGYGIVYTPHVYFGDLCHQALNPDTLLSLWAGIFGVHPVLVTEFGTDCTDMTWASSVITVLNHLRVGWLAYAWNASNVGQYALFTDYASYTPTPFGTVVRAGLKAS